MSNILTTTPRTSDTCSPTSQKAFESSLSTAKGKSRQSADSSSATAASPQSPPHSGEAAKPRSAGERASLHGRDSQEGSSGAGQHSGDANTDMPGRTQLSVGHGGTDVPSGSALQLGVSKTDDRALPGHDDRSTALAVTPQGAEAAGVDGAKWGRNHMPPPNWPGWHKGHDSAAPHPRGHARAFQYPPSMRPHPQPGMKGPVGPGRPNPRGPFGRGPIAPLPLTTNGPLPPLSALSPKWDGLMKEVDGLQNEVLLEQIGRIDNHFESNPDCLWSKGVNLTPAQKVRYLYDLQSSLGRYVGLKEEVAQKSPKAVFTNDKETLRSFHMRIDRLQNDPAIQSWMRNTFAPAMAQKIYDTPPIRQMLLETMKSDVVDGGILKTATAHGVKAGDAVRLHMREYGLLQSMMTPADLKYYSQGAADALGHFIDGFMSPNHIDRLTATQMQAHYGMDYNKGLGSLDMTADPGIRSLAQDTHQSDAKVRADLGALVNATLGYVRKGLKYSEALDKAKISSVEWQQVPAGIRDAYSKGLFHLANMVTSGGAVALKVLAGKPVSDFDRAALAFQCMVVAGLGFDSASKMGPAYAGLPKDTGRFSGANLGGVGSLLGGLGGAVASFMGLVKSVKNGDPASATLGAIAGVSGALGSAASLAEGAMYFAGVSRLDAFGPLKSAFSAISRAVPMSAYDYDSAAARLAARYEWKGPSLVLERVGLAAIGEVTAGLSDIVALALVFYDTFKGEIARSRQNAAVWNDVNGSLTRLFGSGRNIHVDYPNYNPKPGPGHPN